MRWLLCLACVLPAVPATSADTIFRCEGKGGGVSLQSSPCPVDSRQTKRTYEHQDNPEAIRRRAEIEARMHAQRVATPSPRGVRHQRTSQNGVQINDARDMQRARCQRAKADRELLRRLDDAVHRACKDL